MSPKLPDGRVLGEYGVSATDVKAEFIWMSPQVGEAGMFGGYDGLGGYMPLAVAANDNQGVSQIAWVHAGHMGVPIRYSDAAGNTLAQPTGYSVPGFPGQSQTSADLYYNLHRDYDSSTGRYIQADPIGLDGGPSPYSYAMNNPLRYTDPRGKFVPIVIAGVCAAGGCEAIAAGLAVIGGAAIYEYWNHNPINPYPAGSCLFLSGGHGKGGGIGGYGGDFAGNPPSDDEPGDRCDIEYKTEMQYCSRKFGVIPEQYGQCVQQAGINLGLCKSGMPTKGWKTDAQMNNGISEPRPPSPKRRRW